MEPQRCGAAVGRVERADAGMELQRRRHRGAAVILIRFRIAEDGEQTVAADLHDGPAEARNDFQIGPAQMGEQLGIILGLHRAGEPGGSGQVGKQDGEIFAARENRRGRIFMAGMHLWRPDFRHCPIASPIIPPRRKPAVTYSTHSSHWPGAERSARPAPWRAACAFIPAAFPTIAPRSSRAAAAARTSASRSWRAAALFPARNCP